MAHGTAVSEGVRRLPAPALRRHVAEYAGYLLVGPPGQHRGLPSPYLTLIITLDEPLVMAAHPDPGQPPGSFDTLVGGLHQRPALVAHRGRQAGVQVALHPLGARDLLGLPAGELGGIDVSLADVAGPWADRVRERMLAEPTWAGRFAVLDAALVARIAGRRNVAGPGGVAPEVHRAWAQLVGPGREVPVGALAADLGWSTRRLLDRFRAETGVAPSGAIRIARFDRARRRLFARAVAGGPLRLADLAASCGYYDQAHLAREFRALAGCSPSRLVAEELRFVQAAAVEDEPGWAS